MPASSGHGALLWYEPDPDLAPNVWQVVAEINGDLKFGVSRPVSGNLAPHNRGIDEYVTGSIVRDLVECTLNHVFGDNSHDEITEFLRLNKTTGWKGTGPDDPDTGDPTNEWIMSGKVTMFSITYPAREGASSTNFAMRPSGPYYYNGQLWT